MLKIFKHPLTEAELLKLRGEIASLGLRQKEIAQALKYNPQTIYLFLSGRYYSKSLHEKLLRFLKQYKEKVERA